VKTYLVQSWDAEGSLRDNYEVLLPGAREVTELRKFLKKKFSHVTISPVAKKRGGK